ncbi:hypothetical protein, partial [Pseudomonas syringae group genomosp. 7]|uniref:hypothetical protein n=1 Tax=Pseudomonas syringae group genomosp. 7 TaxID=251699 RepID=UPI00376FB1C4
LMLYLDQTVISALAKIDQSTTAKKCKKLTLAFQHPNALIKRKKAIKPNLDELQLTSHSIKELPFPQ